MSATLGRICSGHPTSFLLPLHLEDAEHWGLAHFDFANHTLTYFDPCDPVVEQVTVQSDLSAVGREIARVLNLENPDWVLEFSKNIPHQSNAFDCGVFVLAFAFCLVFNIPLSSFAQSDIPHIRQKLMAFALIQKSDLLMDPKYIR